MDNELKSCEQEMTDYIRNSGFQITDVKYALLILAKHLDEIKSSLNKPVHRKLL